MVIINAPLWLAGVLGNEPLYLQLLAFTQVGNRIFPACMFSMKNPVAESTVLE